MSNITLSDIQQVNHSLRGDAFGQMVNASNLTSKEVVHETREGLFKLKNPTKITHDDLIGGRVY